MVRNLGFRFHQIIMNFLELIPTIPAKQTKSNWRSVTEQPICYQVQMNLIGLDKLDSLWTRSWANEYIDSVLGDFD